MTADSMVASAKPRLRGWFHLAMVPLAPLATYLLLREVNGAGAVSVVVFGGCLLGLYGASSLYHVPRWSRAGVRKVLGRIDTAMIQLFIAGTFTPIAFHTLSGAWRVWSLVIAWVIAVTGATICASSYEAPRWVGTANYIAFGWLSMVPMVKIAGALPWQGSGLIVLGGLLYTVGGILYVKQWPDPWPRWFGFHEVFHLFVIAASACHYLAIWRYVL